MTEIIDILDFMDSNGLHEESFRKKVAAVNWSQFAGKKVIIKGCDKIPVPTWAYLILVSRLTPMAHRIYWGEPCNPVLIHKA